jgi:putative SOS response-associated peptidase YedK
MVDVMCGRYVLHSRDKIKLPGLRISDVALEAHYNIAPSQNVLAIADFGKGLEARLISWGLIPSWSTEGKPFINARAETLEQRPSFSESFRLRRCLIPADGFFEWKRNGKEKRPFYFRSREDSLLTFAGIWDAWRNRGQLIITCAIITTPANELIHELHNRMPAILPPELHAAWLNPATNRVDLLSMLTPFPASLMKTYQVSSKVNAPENDTVDLLDRVDVEIGQTLSLF